jgi:hypothetical protein
MPNDNAAKRAVYIICILYGCFHIKVCVVEFGCIIEKMQPKITTTFCILILSFFFTFLFLDCCRDM